jgi:hypothetical protein
MWLLVAYQQLSVVASKGLRFFQVDLNSFENA